MTEFLTGLLTECQIETLIGFQTKFPTELPTEGQTEFLIESLTESLTQLQFLILRFINQIFILIFGQPVLPRHTHVSVFIVTGKTGINAGQINTSS